MKIKALSLALILVVCLALAGCNSSETANTDKNNPESKVKKELKIACMGSSRVRVEWMKEALEPLGYKVEAVVFDGGSLPPTALKDGDVDGLLINHLPFIKSFNENNGCDLQMIEPYYCYAPTRMYSKKYTSVDQIPDNAVISIANDPSNIEIALKMLRDLGLLKLGEKRDAFYSELDIIENPKNIHLSLADVTTTVRSIDDADAIISFAYYAMAASDGKLDPKIFLYEDPGSKDCPIGLVVQPENLNAEWATATAKALLSDEYVKKFEAEYKGTYALYR